MSGASTPLPGVVVSIPELHRTATTDARGRYRFVDLPAGTFTIAIDTPRHYSQQVVLPDVPANINNANFSVVMSR